MCSIPFVQLPHGSMEEEFYSLMNSNKKTSTDAKGNKTTVYTIPIVFHIIHEYGVENITDAQVKDQMRILITAS